MALEQINSIIADQLDLADESEVTFEALLFDDLGMDTDELSEVIVAIEDAFEIEILEEDAEAFECVEDIVLYVEKSL